MRSKGSTVVAMLLAANVFSTCGPAAPAEAITKEDAALNGTYQVTSNGNLAKINRQSNQEAVVTTTWTISSTCTTFEECTGTVHSAQGWTDRIHVRDGLMWYVTHNVPDWEKCQDGTAFTGRQEFTFYPVDPNGSGAVVIGSPTLAGKDKTIGPSGACGQNQWLTVEMPVRLDKIS